MTAGEVAASVLNGLVGLWMLFWTAWMVGAAVKSVIRGFKGPPLTCR